jgi:hypothetical protein
MKLKSLLVLTGILGITSLVEAQASSVTYLLDQSNIETVMPDNVPYATVTIEDGLTFGTDTNAVKFTVDVINSAFNAGSAFGIQDFGFNLAVGAPAVADSNIVGPAGWTGNIAPPNNQLDGYGRFVGDIKRSGPSIPRSEPLEFWITGVNGDSIASYAAASTNGNSIVTQGNAWFVALVGGFTASDPAITSGYFGGGSGAQQSPAAVPVPAAVWLFGSALAGMVGVRRKKQSN